MKLGFVMAKSSGNFMNVGTSLLTLHVSQTIKPSLSNLQFTQGLSL
jgi:hypothetical protein